MDFVPGLVLCRRFHDEVVGPLLAQRLPGLRYSAGLLDGGSELLGRDTERSTDHDWGPRAQVFLADAAEVGSVRAALADLPSRFLGRPTRFLSWPTARLGVPDVAGDRSGVQVFPWRDWLRDRLGFDPAVAVTTADWLTLPTQRLAEVTGGAVFHDGLPGGAVGAVRAALAWYPDDVWRHVLAAGWTRVGQAEHLVGRCAEVGDALGSRLVAARVARDLMRLGLLARRRWPPYDKWLGSVFAALPDAAPVVAALADALGPGDWPHRQAGLVRALETVAGWTNDTGLAGPVDVAARPFHGRPFLVLDAPRLATALRAAIVDPALRDRPLVGAVDQYVDGVDVLTHAERVRRVGVAVTG
ncbi:DUF4037 domain-containing protein [Micromonospora sp. WMMD734]|uniref:DUF4037 domain-containing protein n=1 Tax=Micromonospora sp. WMMD734 TaxID=3404129 RepID=UPI003B92DF51